MKGVDGGSPGVEAILRGWAGGEDEKRRRRIDEMKEGIARNRLGRLEKEEDEEQEQVEDKDFTRCVVRRWMLGDWVSGERVPARECDVLRGGT